MTRDMAHRDLSSLNEMRELARLPKKLNWRRLWVAITADERIAATHQLLKDERVEQEENAATKAELRQLSQGHRGEVVDILVKHRKLRKVTVERWPDEKLATALGNVRYVDKSLGHDLLVAG